MSRIRDGKTVKLRPETHGRLLGAGGKGETFDDVVNRLLDFWEIYGSEEVEK